MAAWTPNAKAAPDKSVRSRFPFVAGIYAPLRPKSGPARKAHELVGLAGFPCQPSDALAAATPSEHEQGERREQGGPGRREARSPDTDTLTAASGSVIRGYLVLDSAGTATGRSEASRTVRIGHSSGAAAHGGPATGADRVAAAASRATAVT